MFIEYRKTDMLRRSRLNYVVLLNDGVGEPTLSEHIRRTLLYLDLISTLLHFVSGHILARVKLENNIEHLAIRVVRTS